MPKADCLAAGGCVATGPEECSETECNADGPLVFSLKEETDDSEDRQP